MSKLLKKNDIVEVYIEDMTSKGDGVGKFDGYPLFIKNTLIGDRALVKVIKTKKNYGFARLNEILESSENRVEPRCPVAFPCGGCQIQHMDYEGQLKFKEKKVISALEKIGGFTNLPVEEICGMDDPFYYRNKTQLPVGRDKDGKVIMGFYAQGTHSIIDTDHCYIGAKENVEITRVIREFVEKYKISVYDEKNHGGLLRHVLMRNGFNTGEIMVCLVINGWELPYKDKLVEALAKIQGMKSICLNINTSDTNVVLGKENMLLWGSMHITDTIGDMKYKISPLSFFQVNPIQTKKLYDLVKEYADLQGNEVVWDLYCGIGSIGLYLAEKAGKVYGVEIVEDAIRDGEENARLNGIENMEFVVGAAEEVIPRMYEDGARADVVIVDPPRKGCDVKLLDAVIDMEPEKLVYVSCDPATLARDLKYLVENGFRMERVRPVDMFPQGAHVETIARIQRIDS